MVTEGHADIDGVPAGLLKLFSQRNAQVEAKLAESVAAWVDDHDGEEPGPRALYRLERDAVLDSRPGQSEPIEAERLRTEWAERATEAGFARLAVPDGQRHLPGTIDWDEEAVIAEALVVVASSSSTWLRADLAREIAARLPADVASSAREVVEVVDRLSADAADRCVELHPAAKHGVACRRDGRAFTEHVVDRRLSAPAVLDQEARLLSWAAANVGTKRGGEAGENPQTAAVRAVSGAQRLVLVVGPAGTGKTTMLVSAVAALGEEGRAVVGLAPSGKAADVLGRETATPATTLAKLLYEHGRPEGPPPEWQLRPGTSIVLDEAGMASTEDLARLVDLADRRHWRLVCVGDPTQLPAVGPGGMFAHWCESFPAHHLEEVRRFQDAWQGEASLLLRQGDPVCAAHYAARGRLRTVHPALLADRVARLYEQTSEGGATVAITTASTGTARAINVEIQRRRNPRRQGTFIALADGTEVFVGDQVATRRNDISVVTNRGTAVRNRHTWTVTAIGDDGSLTVEDPRRGRVRLPKAYVARHVELGWAVTGYGNQGVTVDHGICVVEPASTRAGIYVGMSRGRGRNVAWVLDRTGLEDAEEAFATAIARPPNARTAHAVRDQLYRVAGASPPAVATPPETLPEDPARRMAERLKQFDGHHQPAARLRR